MARNGLSIIELMIAIFLGMLLIGSTFSMLIGLTQSSKVQSGLMQIQSDARFIMDVFAREIRKAGFRHDILKSFDESFVTDNRRGFGKGIVISGNQNEMTFRFYGSGVANSGPEGNMRDCLGNPVNGDDLVVQKFYLDKSDLICERFLNANRSSTIALASGLTHIDFLYGVETDGDGYADAYKRTPAANDRVVSVRMDIELEAENLYLDTADGTRQEGAQMDTTLKRKYTQLVSLRNVMR